jgi:hypothetical protein
MKKTMLAAAACAALAFSALPGCEEPPEDWVVVGPESAQGDVTLYRDVQFQDIPVPAEYTLLRNESYSFQGSLFRNGILKYQGPVEWTEALDFYRRELLAAGWSLGKTEKGFDFRALYFDKGQERLIVVVRQIRGGSRAELQLGNRDKNDLLLKGKLNDPGY